MSLKLSVDGPRCAAHGLCAEIAPELISLDEWGYPWLKPGPLPPQLVRLAERARLACPVLALRIDQTSD
jgi:ferredoxin